MSLTPSIPSNFTPRSFWKKPEGKLPPWLLLGGVGALVFFFGGPIGAFLASAFANMVALTFYGIVEALLLIGAFVLLTNKEVHNIVWNIFRSVCRAIAWTYTTIDPIGILKNNLDAVKEEYRKLVEYIKRFGGTEQMLQDNIKAQQNEIVKLMSKADQAERMAATEQDPIEKERLLMQKQTHEQNAGMQMDGVKQLMDLEVETKDMLTNFRRWATVSEAKVQRTENQMKYWSMQRKIVLDAQKTLSFGQRLLQGDPEQLKRVDMAIEYLQEESSRTKGEIKEFSEISNKMFTDLKIDNGAAAERARAEFASFKQKLLVSSSAPTVDTMSATFNGKPVAVARITPTVGQKARDEYDPFSK